LQITHLKNKSSQLAKKTINRQRNYSVMSPPSNIINYNGGLIGMVPMAQIKIESL